MKEIVVRQSIYNPNHKHKLLETEVEGEWEFSPAEPWMPLYINGPYTEPESIDSDGFGFPLGLGEVIEGKRVSKIFFRDKKCIIKLEDV